MTCTFKQICTLKLLIAFKMDYSCCFSSAGNMDFPEFPPKKFYNINYRRERELKTEIEHQQKGGHHSSVVSSAPTILQPRVRIPSTPSTLISICIEVVMRKERR